MTQTPRLILFGKQGAGKGTQAQLLVERHNVEHLSTGDIFRAAIKAGTPAGKEARSFIDQGELVPDETVIRVVEEKFETTPELITKGFVLDGFPRTSAQAYALEKLLEEKNAPLHCAINIEVERDIVLKRITGRRVCVECGTNYHVDNPPKKPWTCDVCGGEVRQRPDDSELAINRRLDLYEKETMPLLKFYEDRDLLEIVDGLGEAKEVSERIENIISKRLQG
ncbi:MAG: adenylate kinase [Acidimicrobiia bacterium]